MGNLTLNNLFTSSMTQLKFIDNVCDLFRGLYLFPKPIKWVKLNIHNQGQGISIKLVVYKCLANLITPNYYIMSQHWPNSQIKIDFLIISMWI